MQMVKFPFLGAVLKIIQKVPVFVMEVKSCLNECI